MRGYITFLLLINSFFLFSQKEIDYNKIVDSVCRKKCGESKMEDIDYSIEHLTSLDVTQITKGLDLYYYDLGMNYYLKAVKSQGVEEDYSLAISAFNNAIQADEKRSNKQHKSIIGSAHNNLAVIYFFEKKYDLAKTNLVLYKKYTNKKYWDRALINKIEAK